MTNQERFLSVYREELENAMTKHPELYMRAFPDDVKASADYTFERMKPAILRGVVNKDSHAFKATCKRLGIPFTYKGIAAYLAG